MSSNPTPYRGWSGLRRALATPAALTMLFLGFGSGLPFLLVGGTVSFYWAHIKLEPRYIGLISYVGLFYVFKFLWAPVLDGYLAPFLGRLGSRRSWLVLSQLSLVIGLSAAAALMSGGTPAMSERFYLLLAVLAFVAFAGATQDIVVDAYRIEIAPVESQGALLATYSLGYRMALIASGAGVMVLAARFGWPLAYGAMALLMWLPLLASLLSPEPSREKRRESLHFIQLYVQPLSEFFSRNGWGLALGLLLFLGLFKFPDQLIGVMAGPFYKSCGYSLEQIAVVSKVFGVWMSFLGAFVGAFVVARFSMRTSLILGAVALAVSNLAFLFMAHFPISSSEAKLSIQGLLKLWPFVVAIMADNISQGLAGGALVAFMSSLTTKKFTAFQYALLVSLANLPGKIAGGLTGFLVEAVGYSQFFILSTLSVIPTLMLLLYLSPRVFLKKQETPFDNVKRS